MSLREDLIDTAVKFLANPSIRRSPLEKKRHFLLTKGLTEEEIQMAFEKGAAYLLGSPSSTDVFLYRHSKLAQFRHLFLNVAMFGSVAYGLYWLYKRWFESFLFGDRPKKKTTEERLYDMKKTIEALMNDLKQEIITVRSEVDRLNNLQGMNSITRGQFENLKSDIASVKGILLNRNQFPALRTEPPSIPAWQLQSAQAKPADHSPPPSDHEKDGEPEAALTAARKEARAAARVRGERSESGGSRSSEGEAVTKNSDSSLEIM